MKKLLLDSLADNRNDEHCNSTCNESCCALHKAILLHACHNRGDLNLYSNVFTHELSILIQLGCNI